MLVGLRQSSQPILLVASTIESGALPPPSLPDQQPRPDDTKPKMADLLEVTPCHSG